ncbi:conserved exported hypothetical protein [Xenorhabdus nematophila F1]|uniref:aspartyl protease family protein n=1 Tax=Xenorhabdus nematophila TaxID=628 RepID=UPI000327586A|nr:aspartyl protease family protein [Xenorhabdus nematophila]CCW31362.1 conserved exported hypothetical protein [Xenorhabdus nematophila F1]
MEKINFWLSKFSCAALAICCTSCLADSGNSVTLKLNYDKYFTPHATFIINGHPVNMMIDTGSSKGFYLQEPQLKKIQGLKKESTYYSTNITGKRQENTEYLAASLDMNGLKLKNVTVIPFKQWGALISNTGKLPDGPVVGLDAFKDKQIMLDFVSHSFTMSDSFIHNMPVPKGFNAFTFHMSPDGMVFDVDQSGHTYHLILDTGATASVIWRERLKQYEPKSCLLVYPKMDNEGCQATLLTIKSKTGNPQHFGAVVVVGNFKHMGNVDGLLGNNFLRNRKVLIDFKNKKVFISDEHRNRKE